MTASLNVRTLPVAALAFLTLAACGSGDARDNTGGDSAKGRATTTATTRATSTATTVAPATTTTVVSTGPEEHVFLDTTAGTILIDLFEREAPGHAENMKKLVRQGYYADSPFHRVIGGFMAQGGGQWSGGPGNVVDVGYTIPAEITPGMRHERGSVAAARKPDQVNPNRESSGSQFYIAYGPTPHLDGDYTVFGRVIAGLETVDAITKGAPGSGTFGDPSQATTIKSAKLVPAAAP